MNEIGLNWVDKHTTCFIKTLLRIWNIIPQKEQLSKIIIPFIYKGQWRGALMFSLICVWINGWVNNRWWFETPSWSLWRQCNDIKISKHFTKQTKKGTLNCSVRAGFAKNYVNTLDYWIAVFSISSESQSSKLSMKSNINNAPFHTI